MKVIRKRVWTDTVFPRLVS